MVVPRGQCSATLPISGPLAQLARALPSHGRGHWFESSTAHKPHTFRGFAPVHGVCGPAARCLRLRRALHAAGSLRLAVSPEAVFAKLARCPLDSPFRRRRCPLNSPFRRFAGGGVRRSSLAVPSDDAGWRRWMVMTAISTHWGQPALTRERVRLRCLGCDVAWTADGEDICWVCERPGVTLRTALSLREDDHLHLDFQ